MVENFNDFTYQITMPLVTLFSAATVLIPVIFAVVLLLLTFLIFHIAEAIPLYKLAKKMDRKNAWLVWIPVFGSYFRLYTLMDIAGDKEVVIFSEKFRIQNRRMSYLIFVMGSLALNIILSAMIFVAILSAYIPLIGILICMIVCLIVSVLYYIPGIALTVIRYIYFKDVLDIFREDKSENNLIAILVVLIDLFVTGGLARIIFLYTLINRDPIPEETMEIPTEAFAETVSE